jgi:hypothetical protein
MDLRKNIYAFNLLKSYKIDFNQNESFMISRILDLNNNFLINKLSLKETTEKLLKIFYLGSYETWSITDRICFSYRDSYSNQIRILSSVQNDKIDKNKLNPGYSCLIAENSSLVNFKEGGVRIYGEINNVINSFVDNNKKIQRSLLLLQQSKVKSGLTIPLKINNEIAGYLFLNSASPSIYDNLSEHDYSILCLLQLTFQSILSQHVSNHFDFNILKSILRLQNKNQLSFELLKLDLERCFYECFLTKIDFQIVGDIDPDVLLPHRKMVNTLLTSIKHIKEFALVKQLTLKFNQTDKNQFNIELFVEDKRMLDASSLNSSQITIDGVEIKNAENKIIFLFQCESRVDGLLYSVA